MLSYNVILCMIEPYYLIMLSFVQPISFPANYLIVHRKT